MEARSKDMPTPVLQNFEIHGTSKKRYDSIHDTIQLFNMMKEAREAVRSGTFVGKRGQSFQTSPSLLGLSKEKDDQHSSKLHLDAEYRRKEESRRQET